MNSLEEKAISYIEEFKNSTEDGARMRTLQQIARLLSERHTANEIYAVIKRVDEIIPLLISLLKDQSVSVHLKKSTVSFFKDKTMYPEVYYALNDVFQQGIEQDNVSYYAAQQMMDYHDKLEETKEIFVEALRSDIEYTRLIALAAISLWKKVGEWDYAPLFSRVVKEDKSPKVREAAWSRLRKKDKIKSVLIPFLLEDILPSSLYDVLSQFQPDIQVPLDRIIVLTKGLPYQKIQELTPKVLEEHINVSKEQYEKAIKELIESEQIVGEYFELEQVFVRKKSKEQLIKPVSFSKEYICYFCGNPIEADTKTCSACQNKVVHCNVCKLPITFGQEVGKCSLCEVKGHLTHFQEWVKVKGKCPTCMKKIPVEGVVPISGVEVKK